MKLSQLKPAVDVFAEALGAAGAQMSASGFLAIGSFFAEFPEVQVTALVRRGAQLRPTEASSHRSESDISCAVTVALLDALAKILELGGAKAAFVKDLLSFNQLLRGLGESETLSAALDKLRASMRPEPVEQVVDNYIKRLKGEMGTAAFDRTFAELQASQLKREEVVAIAMSVYGGLKKNTSRKGALAYIRKPHDAHMSAKRGIQATGGRSAA